MGKLFCLVHQKGEDGAADDNRGMAQRLRPRPEKEQQEEEQQEEEVPKAKKLKKEPAGFLKSYSVSVEDNDNYIKIKQFIRDKVKSYEKDPRIQSGVRRLLEFDEEETKVLHPCLLAMVEEARKEIKFPLRWPMMGHPGYIVVAPKCGAKSNSWKAGKIHRDFSNPEISGVYTFMLFLDPVTKDNGAIQIWRESKTCPVEPHHKERGILQRRLAPELVLGGEGTLKIWDARLLHRSLPNTTTRDRTTLLWMIKNKHGGPDIDNAN